MYTNYYYYYSNRALGVTFYQMCTNSLPFNSLNGDECKFEVLNKATPTLPDKFKEYNDLLIKYD